MRFLSVAILSVFLALSLLTGALAQEPGPVATPTPGGTPVTLCDLVQETIGGGQVIPAGKITFRTGVGYTYSYAITTPAQGNPQLRVCVQEFNSDITIDSVTGKELSRVVNSPAATTVLDRVVGSVRFIANPPLAATSTPQPPGPPPSSAGGAGVAAAAPLAPQSQPITGQSTTACSSTICPPNTGDAGLR